MYLYVFSSKEDGLIVAYCMYIYVHALVQKIYYWQQQKKKAKMKSMKGSITVTESVPVCMESL